MSLVNYNSVADAIGIELLTSFKYSCRAFYNAWKAYIKRNYLINDVNVAYMVEICICGGVRVMRYDVVLNLGTILLKTANEGYHNGDQCRICPFPSDDADDDATYKYVALCNNTTRIQAEARSPGGYVFTLINGNPSYYCMRVNPDFH